MENIHNIILNCTNCDLRFNQKPLIDNLVIPKIFWVGLSAVKVNSDLDSKPLSEVTNTGKLINNIESNFKDIIFYKTNLVKCLPLLNNKIRYPNKNEMSKCFNNYQLEFDFMSPKLIFLLGKQVSEFFCNHYNFNFNRFNDDFKYEEFTHNDSIFIPIHHPSYILVYKRKNIENYRKSITSLISKHNK